MALDTKSLVGKKLSDVQKLIDDENLNGRSIGVYTMQEVMRFKFSSTHRAVVVDGPDQVIIDAYGGGI